MKRLDDYRMRMMLVGIVAALVLGVGRAKADFTWMQRADMPTPRRALSTCAVNGKIYAIGGASSEPENVKLSTVEEYDPATDTWTRKADMPTARSSFSTSVVSGKIYAIGGSRDSGSVVEEYDPATDTWMRKADMPTPRRWLATCAVNGKIYAIGGLTSAAIQGSRIVEEYDPMTDTWTRKADMPTGLWALCANVVSGKIYALGGRPGYTAIPNVQEYDPATDTWTRKADMPVGTSQMASVVLGDKIVVIGGWISSGNFPYTTVQMYDSKTDIWTIETETPFLRSCFSAEVVRGRIFGIGGTDRPHPCPATSTVYELVISGPHLWIPIVDFNGDGIVDSTDMCIMVDHWGTDESLCDIGPMPWGDGIVDVEDLKVLAEHLFEQVNDPTLLAHWPLDEVEGGTAHDSVSGNDDYVIGNPLWQPTGGAVDGALELDGVGDCIITGFGLNPAEGPFSIFAWIKGGAPGQVIVAQQVIANWLSLDADGRLMTELKDANGLAVPLISETIITDGHWHRIGLVWDGSYRTLCVDGVAVSEYTQTSLLSSDRSLYIGCGKAMEPGTYFSGLIDDVRIYNRVVKP